MTLKQYLQILGKRIWILITVVVIIMLATYIFTIKTPDKYSGSLSIYSVITQQEIPQNQGQFYEYDNYYAFQSSEIFASTIVNWLKDPANVAQIYSSADQALPDVALKKYSKLITAKKNEPSTVQITIQSNNQQFVEKLIDSTQKFVVAKTEEWKTKGLIDNTDLDISNPIIVKEKLDLLMNMGIALILSIVLGLALVYFTEYMQTKDNK